MFTLLMICALAGGTTAGFASSQYAGAGFNGGFASNYVGPNVAGAAAGTGAFTPGFAPYQPIPAFPNAFDFNSFFQGLQANFANLYQQQLAHQNALFNSIRQQQAAFAANANSGNYGGATGGGGSGGNGAGFGAAGASASYGPSGFHQTAHIFPENPSSPNINTRFGSDAPPGGPGFVGVSSFSSSSNINGQSHREAATTVNDNGKVTSYHVRS
ncbi:anaphase-promoting complex subunit 6 isoform X2 [Sabethes cyaneus]|uniref:anaphase-promoting complex subunit 6 isoform X2 n=1 Tax=Sabethes cyaneus TaxID=53552 RepID=UPI00237ECBF3|nr:anaphase-promoting complex subunit 6 isoform X2 [Sabethes cyaneus]